MNGGRTAAARWRLEALSPVADRSSPAVCCVASAQKRADCGPAGFPPLAGPGAAATGCSIQPNQPTPAANAHTLARAADGDGLRVKLSCCAARRLLSILCPQRSLELERHKAGDLLQQLDAEHSQREQVSHTVQCSGPSRCVAIGVHSRCPLLSMPLCCDPVFPIGSARFVCRPRRRSCRR